MYLNYPDISLAFLTTTIALTFVNSCLACSPTTEPTIQELFQYSTAVVSARVTAIYRHETSNGRRILPEGMYTTQVKVFCQYKGESTLDAKEFNVSMAGFNHGRCTAVEFVEGGSYVMWLLNMGYYWQHVSATPLKLTTSNMGKMRRVCGANIRRINVSKKSPMFRQCRPPSKPVKGCKDKVVPNYAVAKVGESRSSVASLAPLHLVISLVIMTCSAIFI